MKRKRLPLLDDDGECYGGNEELQLHINKEYAARLEHNKRREELHRLQERMPELAARLEAKERAKLVAAEGDESKDSESSSDDDEAEADLPAAVEPKFLEVLAKIKRRDEAIYKVDAQFFPEPGSGGEEEEGVQKKIARKAKPKFLRDVLAQQALKGTGELSDEDDAAADGRASPTYKEEQETLRQAFLQAAEQGGGPDDAQDAFGGVLKRKGSQLLGASGNDGAQSADQHATQALLDSYFGTDAQLDEGDRFLKTYLQSQSWLDEGGGGEAPLENEDAGNLEEDEAYVEAAERFEAHYNFRNEEPGGTEMATYPRMVEGGVRKADERRRKARDAKAERRAADTAQREAQVRRLKTLKRREIEERLARVRSTAGGGEPDAALAAILAGADFEPDEYDAAMAAAFGDAYYEAEDADLPAGADEDDNDAGDVAAAFITDDEDLGGSPVDGRERRGFEATRARLQAQRAARASPGAGADVAEERAEVERLVAEYCALDAEDVVGGVACRFRYRSVPAANYGLGPEDVLALPDRELNQVVSLKRLAPYRDDDGLVRPNYGKLRELGVAAGEKSSMPKRVTDAAKRERKQQRAQRRAQQALGRAIEGLPASEGFIAPNMAGRAGPAAAAAASHKHDSGPPFEDHSKKEVRQGAAGNLKSPAGQLAKRAAGAEEWKGGAKPGGAGRPQREQSPAAEAALKGDVQLSAARLASYAKPMLRRPKGQGGPGVGRKSKRMQQGGSAASPPLVNADGTPLTKAQKKNLWRHRRRLAKHGPDA